MALRSRLEFIGKEDYTRIHEASLKILAETGVAFHDDEAVELFKKHGARVNGKVVYISRELVEKALAATPSKFKWSARNDQQSVIVGDGFIQQPNVGPVYIQDMDKGRRLATLQDYTNIQKLCQASDVINLVGSIPVDPSDVANENKHLSMMYEIIKNTDKPIIGMCTEGLQAKHQLDMVAMAVGGQQFLADNPCVGVLVNPLSPLAYAPETIQTMREYAKLRQPLLLAPCIMAGVTAPISLLGTSVLQNTEFLAGLVFSQLVGPGTPVVYGNASTRSYFKRASFCAGTPEAMMINTSNIQMGLEFYNLPTRTMCGITESKILDAQAGYESMMSLMMGMMSGAHIAVQCLGVLDAIMATSYEKFILDEEMVRRALHIYKGIDTSDEALSVDIIQEMGQNGSYLMHTNTFEHFRESWTPTVSEWGSYDEWVTQGSEDVVVRANRKYKEILNNAPESLIDKDLDNDLQRYIEKASI
ncbi:trimethylamine methyltransferase family protein [Desulfosporosinus sp.]|uniref:trimethylamine methyltransferase family protein n=1 Tax=Desulfosporosinus sp. TaxID=157907 RepID=UPI0023151A1E|nr:trimethylamine methyltransferase family protein [Desulfosporosinus sp.]MDA8220991.1 trimethylamine methyltransferase family protein [Desulfitobacterium hafniense]